MISAKEAKDRIIQLLEANKYGITSYHDAFVENTPNRYQVRVVDNKGKKFDFLNLSKDYDSAAGIFSGFGVLSLSEVELIVDQFLADNDHKKASARMAKQNKNPLLIRMLLKN